VLETAAEIVQRLADSLADRTPKVLKNERYFRGEQPLTYASDEWSRFNERRFAHFSDNWCGVVGSSPAERIRLTGISLGDDTEIVSDNERALMKVWADNEMDAQSSQGFLHTIVAGRSFVMVWPGDDGPQVTWERADQCIVDYDEATRRPRYALKVWNDGIDEYATLYTSTQLFKFERKMAQRIQVAKGADIDHDRNFRATAGAAPYGDPGAWIQRDTEGEAWPLPNPLGMLPLVEVPNRPVLGGEPMSDIAGVIAMQDAINLLWAYLFAAADFASMPARVVMGQEPPKIPILDDAGTIIGEKPVDIEQLTRGRMLWLTGQETSVGQWDSAKLDIFTDVIQRAVRTLAAQTRTPVHYLVGESLGSLNSESLLVAESGLVAKVTEFQLFASGPMRQIFRLIAVALGDTELADDIRSSQIVWKDPQTRTQAQTSDAALKDRQVGFPFSWIAAKRYGLSPAEVERLVAIKEAESLSLLSGDLALAFAPKPDPAPNAPQG